MVYLVDRCLDMAIRSRHRGYIRHTAFSGFFLFFFDPVGSAASSYLYLYRLITCVSLLLQKYARILRQRDDVISWSSALGSSTILTASVLPGFALG